jgi:hypothetical protein
VPHEAQVFNGPALVASDCRGSLITSIKVGGKYAELSATDRLPQKVSCQLKFIGAGPQTTQFAMIARIEIS